MKKIAALLGLILILAMVFCPAVSAAGGLSIVETFPEDGEGGKQPQNMAVKIVFSEEMDGRESNQGKFSITDANGKGISFQLVHSDKYPNELWVVLSETLESNLEYKVHIASGIQAASGASLMEASDLTFKTRNTKNDSYISLAMMAGMMVVMFAASSKAAKKQAEAQAAGGAAPVKKAENLNPYKLAKEKNISLEEAKALVEKEKAKQAKQNERIEKERAKKEEALAAEMAEVQKRLEEEEEAARKANNYRVKRAHSIKEAGFEVPKAVVKKNRKKREAAAAAAKAKAKSNKKK